MRTRPHRWQQGQSLVGMMVGLVISLLTIAAMLVIYKNMIETSGNALRGAQRDGQVASALLAAQIDMQQAGYGIGAEQPLESRLSVSADGRQVAWRFKPDLDQADRCAGLRLVDTAGPLPRGLYRLPAIGCTTVAGTTWSDAQAQPIAADIAFFEPVDRTGASYLGAERERGALTLQPAPGEAGYRFHATADACLPFRQQQDVTVTGQRVTLRQSSQAVLFSVCLPNLAVLPAS